MNKLDQIKSSVETFSELGLKIWCQHLWEYRFFGELRRNDPNFTDQLKLVDDLYDHCAKIFENKTKLPGYFVRGYPSMRNMDKYQWLK